MIKVNSPEFLFDKQKFFAISKNVSKKPYEPYQAIEIAIVYNYPASENLPAAEEEQLQKILSACKLKPEQIIFVNTAFNNESAAELRSRYATQKFICFGDEELSRNFSIKPYKVYQIDSMRFLKADTLQVLAANQPKKKLLWEQLQQLFDLK